MSDEQQVVAHAETFRLFAEIKMIAEILLIGGLVHAVDELLQQLADTVGSDLVVGLDIRLPQKGSAML